MQKKKHQHIQTACQTLRQRTNHKHKSLNVFVVCFECCRGSMVTLFSLCRALSLKAFLLFSCHALIEPNIRLSHCAVLCLCASYACCWNVCFSFSLFVGVLTIGVLVFLFRPGTQCKCQQVGDLELRESISLSGWNLIFVARGLLKTSITVVVLNVIFNHELVRDFKTKLKL